MKWKALLSVLVLSLGLYWMNSVNDYPQGKYANTVNFGAVYKFIGNYEFKQDVLSITFAINDGGTIVPIYRASGKYTISGHQIVFKLDKIKPLNNAFYSFNSITLFGLSLYDSSLYNGNRKVTIKIPYRIDGNKLYLTTNNIEDEFIKL